MKFPSLFLLLKEQGHWTGLRGDLSAPNLSLLISEHQTLGLGCSEVQRSSPG